MKKLLCVLGLFAFASCSDIKFERLSDDLFVNHMVNKSGVWYYSVVTLKNVSNRELHIKMVCDEGDNFKGQIYDIILPPKSIKETKLHDISAFSIRATYECDYFEMKK